jgi:eukaryotic-like serine/threonine-protein kinase
VPTSLQESLQAALGDAYRIERELAPGGMSRVFLATEASLKRAVVIKVLPAELTNEVSAARFKREIEVTAHLQHPHVLPVLAAGARDGLLWYVMPYVEGESLRHRLARERQLPIPDATRLLDEVADALAFAHSRGVVHRDIKPENILLQEGHAVLADFGIARALLEARTGEQLTATGLGLGTPGYMAPEQAAGESHVDARADVYALGVVGYEMLAGLPPFTGASAQAVIAAHRTAVPRPLRELRPDAPTDLAATIARALAKSPDERFQSAAEFRGALRAGRTPAASKRSRVIAAVIAAVVVLAAGIGTAYAYRARATRPLDADLLAVAPFDVLDPSLQLWHEGMVDLLSRNLDVGALRTVSPSTVIRGWTGRADNESATTLGRRTGARLALIGTMLGAGRDSVQIDATLLDVTAGRPLGQFQFRAASDHVARLADSVSVAVWRLLGRTGRADLPPRVASLGTTSLPAMKAFLRGEQFYRKSAWDSSIVYFDQGIALDSSFALAYSRLGMALSWNSNSADAAAIRNRLRAGALNHGLSPRDSMAMLADSLEASLYTAGASDARALLQTRREFAMLEAAVQRYGDDAELRYRLGEAYYHYGYGATTVDLARVLSTFDRAIALDSAFVSSYYHPAEIALRLLRDRERSVRYLRAYLARADTTGRSGYMGVMAALLDRPTLDDRVIDSVVTTVPERTLVMSLWQMELFPDSGEAAVRLGRSMLARSRRPGAMALSRDAHGHIMGTLAFRGHIREALALGGEEQNPISAELRLIGRVPGAGTRELLDRWTREWSTRKDPPYFLSLIPTLASERDTASILRILHLTDRFLKNPDSSVVSGVTRTRTTINAYLSLARGDSAAALHGFESLRLEHCVSSCRVEPLVTARLLAARGRLVEADSILSRRWRIEGGLLAMLYASERGRVAERLGNRAEAIEAYSLVAEAWAKADAELQPAVTESRQGLKRLGGDASIARGVTSASGSRP